MRRLIITVLAILVFCANSAHAYTLKGPASLTDPIAKSIEILPPCVMNAVEKGGLKTINVVKPGKLGDFDLGGVHYYREADSFFKSGNVYIDERYVDNSVVVLHEMGHWWDQGSLKPYREAWNRAVSLDYVNMSPAEQGNNAYLEDPDEAFAELFAYHFLGDRYKSKHYKPALFPRSNAMLSQILAKSC